jgi:hypothetical protein
MTKSVVHRQRGRTVTWVILVIVAVLLLAGLFYVRGRRT